MQLPIIGILVFYVFPPKSGLKQTKQAEAIKCYEQERGPPPKVQSSSQNMQNQLLQENLPPATARETAKKIRKPTHENRLKKNQDTPGISLWQNKIKDVQRIPDRTLVRSGMNVAGKYVRVPKRYSSLLKLCRRERTVRIK